MFCVRSSGLKIKYKYTKAWAEAKVTTTPYWSGSKPCDGILTIEGGIGGWDGEGEGEDFAQPPMPQVLLLLVRSKRATA